MIEEYEILISEQIPHLSWLLSLYSSGWLPLLYILIGCALTIYWNLDNDGMINGTIMFGWFAWPVFLVLFIPGFLSDIKFNHIENKKVCEWNKKNGIGLCIEFTDSDKTQYSGKTRGHAYLNGIMGACVDIRDDKKDGKYHIDYIYPLSGLRICGM